MTPPADRTEDLAADDDIAPAAAPADGPEIEPHGGHNAGRLNWLRAGVLGANDGIVSTAGLVVGVAAADPTNTPAILTAGVAGLVSGAVSMALGEYVSVSTQRDTEKALIRQETWELEHMPEKEYDELVGLYEAKGLTPDTARRVATELTHADALGAHLDAELNIDRDELANPWHAAGSSAIAFTCGAALPVLAMVLTPGGPARIPVAFLVVILALALTGFVSARLGGARAGVAMTRVLVGGALAMAVTWAIGHVMGVSAG